MAALAYGASYAFLALMFCAWLISLIGLAGLHSHCDRGHASPLSGPTDCSSEYRFHWWVIAFEFIILAGITAATALNRVPKTKLSWMGMFTVASVLYIYGTARFFTMQHGSRWSDASTALSSGRLAFVGFLLTALGNLATTWTVAIEAPCHTCEVVRDVQRQVQARAKEASMQRTNSVSSSEASFGTSRHDSRSRSRIIM